MGRRYTWLSDPGEPIAPLAQGPATWAERDTTPRPPVHESPLHRHTDDCLGIEYIVKGNAIFPPIRLRQCSVLGEGKHPQDEKFMAFMGFVDPHDGA